MYSNVSAPAPVSRIGRKPPSRIVSHKRPGPMDKGRRKTKHVNLEARVDLLAPAAPNKLKTVLGGPSGLRDLRC